MTRRHGVGRLVLGVLLTGAIACGADPATGVDSGIEGLVLIGPTCPVEEPDRACDDAPYAARIEVIDPSDGSVVAATRSGEDGRFRVALPPGSYRLQPVSGASSLPHAEAVEVTVRAHRYEIVTIRFDSGIR